MSAQHTPSPERAEAFYGAVFGWKLEPVPGAPFAVWRLPECVGGEADRPLPRDVVAVVAATEDGDEVPPHWAVNFRVDDVDATAEQAVALGGTLVLARGGRPRSWPTGGPANSPVVEFPPTESSA